MSVHSISDIFYILRKDLLRLLCGGLHVVPEDKDMILEVLGRDEWRDLEDGLQMQCAKEAWADYVVTQNLKDFQKSEIEAVSEEHFCEILKNGGFVRIKKDDKVMKYQGEDENASPF